VFLKAPLLSNGHPSPRGGRKITVGNSRTCPLRGTRSKAESREAQVKRKLGKGASKFCCLKLIIDFLQSLYNFNVKHNNKQFLNKNIIF